ncbi:MAG: hypothetical protein WDO17_10905 [Alphaproteobacteria bacterium]
MSRRTFPLSALALALATLLSGCFGSDRPMFPPESGVPALEPGPYALFEQYGDQTKPSEYMEIRQHGSVYDFINEKGASNPVSFHPIAGGMHVAQVGGMPQPNTDKKGYGYALFRINGREALVYVVECGKQDKAMLAAARVEIRGQYECFIDNVADPAAFFAGLKRSDPASRMLRD